MNFKQVNVTYVLFIRRKEGKTLSYSRLLQMLEDRGDEFNDMNLIELRLLYNFILSLLETQYNNFLNLDNFVWCWFYKQYVHHMCSLQEQYVFRYKKQNLLLRVHTGVKRRNCFIYCFKSRAVTPLIRLKPSTWQDGNTLKKYSVLYTFSRGGENNCENVLLQECLETLNPWKQFLENSLGVFFFSNRNRSSFWNIKFDSQKGWNLLNFWCKQYKILRAWIYS